LSIMTDILFCVNTVLSRVSIIHFSSHVMCSMCIHLCECRAHLIFVFLLPFQNQEMMYHLFVIFIFQSYFQLWLPTQHWGVRASSWSYGKSWEDRWSY
jgi:hypothetical protein